MKKILRLTPIMFVLFILSGCAATQPQSVRVQGMDELKTNLETLNSFLVALSEAEIPDEQEKSTAAVQAKEIPRKPIPAPKEKIINVYGGEEIDNLNKRIRATEKLAKENSKALKKQNSRLAEVEDIVGYHHPSTKAKGVAGFLSGKWELTKRQKRFLDKRACSIKKGEEILKEIIGYADNVPGNPYLPQQRAEAAAEYLKKQGVNLDGVTIRGGKQTDRYGGRRENRRFTIITEEVMQASAEPAKKN